MNSARAWTFAKKTARAASWYSSFQAIRPFRVALLRWKLQSGAGLAGGAWGWGSWGGLITFYFKKTLLSHLLLLYCFVPHSCHSLHPVEHEFYEGNEYLSSLPADADRAEDFEYEVRSWAHFSLSFCYYRYGIYTADSRLLWEKEEWGILLKNHHKRLFCVIPVRCHRIYWG